MACVHGRGCRCRCIGALAWGSSLRWFVTHGCSTEGVNPCGPVLSLPGGFIGALYIFCFRCLILDHIPAGGGLSCLHSTGVPKTHPPMWAGGLGARYRMDLEALLIPRAKNLLLWRIFLSSNQWKCVYQETMFDLDKCFTDVNKAGERDRGRRDKEGWERRKAATGRTRREKR